MNTTNQTEVKDKRNLYKTARARISCAQFKQGDFVSVRYYGRGYAGDNSGHYFICSSANNPDLPVVYPEHHLTSFCL